jgi:hypothetical protein
VAFGGFAEPKRIFWVPASDHFFADALDEFEEVAFRAVSQKQ